MLADQPQPPPALGEPDTTILHAGAFREAIVALVETELPIWRDRPERPSLDDEPHLNEFLSGHLNSASRRRCFDVVQFLPEPVQIGGRRGDIAVKALGTLMIEDRLYYDFEQLLMVECKRLPTPSGSNRSSLEYVDGLVGHRTGGIERFKHALHGHINTHAIMIAYVQTETFEHWLSAINSRLAKLAEEGADGGLWDPAESLVFVGALLPVSVRRLSSRHRRMVPPATSGFVELYHLWLAMN